MFVPVMSRRGEIAAGIQASLAAGLGLYPLGIALGLLVMQAGLPWWITPGLSIAAYAGSLELLLVGLMTSITPLPTIALTTLLVNFRHVFYAFSFPLKVVKNPLARLYSVYALTDESYAVTAVNPTGWTAPKLLTTQFAFQFYWVMGGLTGVLLANLISASIKGLEFALCALFITLTLDAARDRSQITPLLMAGLSVAFAKIVTPNAVLFTALLVFVILLVFRFIWERRNA